MPKKKQTNFYSGTGKRKTAIAAVWMYDKKGDILINGKPVDEVLKSEKSKLLWVRPFHTVGVSHPSAKFSATVKMSGGGKSSWAEALSLGFARALVNFNPEFKSKLRKAKLLTRDSREVESKKYYLHKARKAPQYSKR